MFNPRASAVGFYIGCFFLLLAGINLLLALPRSTTPPARKARLRVGIIFALVGAFLLWSQRLKP